MRSAEQLAAVALVVTALLAPTLRADDAVTAVAEEARGEHAAVAADHRVASDVGIAILQQGGNAADAAVAVALVLGVVNPFASGIGGGGFALWHDAETGEVVALDFRETAPASAHRDMYVVDGQVDPMASRRGGLAVAVPGEVAGLYALHERYGALPWADVVEPARALAADGFDVDTLLPLRIAADEDFAATPELASRFTIDGRPVMEGDLLVRADLGAALAAIQTDGPSAFYEGEVARDIVAAVAREGGTMTLEDLAGYAPRWMEPTRASYRGYEVFGMPGPSSGGMVLATTLAVLDRFELGRFRPSDAMATHIIVQALGHTFADRAEYMGDPSFVDVPAEALMSADRVDEIERAFDPLTTLPPEAYGMRAQVTDDHGTSHLSVVDAYGNAVALTTTVNTSFGSHVVTDTFGILLNNEMDDFSAQPGVPNAFGLVGTEANAIAPGKRPLSSMSPTIVTRDGELVGALGGSGGPMIITGTLLALVNLLDFDATPAQAVSAPRFHHQWMPPVVWLEPSDIGPQADELSAFGYQVDERTFGSAIQVVWRVGDAWVAASDPRKHGVPAAW